MGNSRCRLRGGLRLAGAGRRMEEAAFPSFMKTVLFMLLAISSIIHAYALPCRCNARR